MPGYKYYMQDINYAFGGHWASMRLEEYFDTNHILNLSKRLDSFLDKQGMQ